MSTDSSAAISSAGMARAAAQLSQAANVSAPANVGAAAPAKGPAPAMPQKAELTINPQERAREVREAIESLNAQMRDTGRALAFSVDESLNRTVVTVTNSETGTVVRQIPDEALLRVAHNIDRVKGLMQDERI